jgi:hypothetical protein
MTRYRDNLAILDPSDFQVKVAETVSQVREGLGDLDEVGTAASRSRIGDPTGSVLDVHDVGHSPSVAPRPLGNFQDLDPACSEDDDENMTILGVLWTDDAVYFGADAGERYADQQASGQGAFYYVPKLKVEQLGSRAVLWGYYDNGVRGNELARWLRENGDSLPDVWSDAIQAIGKKWTEINTRQEWAATYGFVGVLISGWLGGERRGYFLPSGSAGTPVSFKMMGYPNPFFAGVGTVAAKVAFMAAKAAAPETDDAHLLEIAMVATIQNVDTLSSANRSATEPLNLIRMNQDGSFQEIRGWIGGQAERVAD